MRVCDLASGFDLFVVWLWFGLLIVLLRILFSCLLMRLVFHLGGLLAFDCGLLGLCLVFGFRRLGVLSFVWGVVYFVYFGLFWMFTAVCVCVLLSLLGGVGLF